jgi:hypothetical protein
LPDVFEMPKGTRAVLSRMIAAGIDDHTVMALSGHSSTRMLER